MTDLKSALRRPLKDPGFTVVAVLTLALCIGANVVIFAVVDCVILRPLPFADSARLVTTVNAYPKAGVPRGASSLPNYYDRRKAIAAFEKTAATRSGTAIVGDPGSPKRVEVQAVSTDFFSTLGVWPARGRFFSEEEMDDGANRVVVLTYEYWRAHYNGDPGVIGREMRIDGLNTTIIGILPPGFRYLSGRTELFLPLRSSPEERGLGNRHSNNLQIVARLRPGITKAVAQAQIDALNAQQMADDPFRELVQGAGFRTDVFSLHEDHIQLIRPTLWFLQAGVLVLLLIGGVNLVNLLLVRASGRAKEFAVREALGAGRWQISRILCVEAVFLSVLGGIFGLVLGAMGIHLLSILRIDRLPLGGNVALTGRVAVATLLASFVTGLLLALPTIWFILRGKLAVLLQAESRGGTANRAAQRLRHGFIVGQVALAFVLLVSAGLLGQSLQRVLAVSPGFRPDHVLTGQLALPWNNYREPGARLAFVERLLSELEGKPGVISVGVNTAMPMTGNGDNNAISVEDHIPQPGESLQAHYTSGSAGKYWQAMGVTLREGRLLEAADNHREQLVCVVDDDFARRYWPRGGALGRRLSHGPIFTNGEAYTIVGVVGRVKHNELGDMTAQGAVYYPYRHYAGGAFYIVVRTTTTPESFASTLRQAVTRLDPELPVDDLRPMQARIDESLVPRRSPTLLATIFAIAALLLAGVGTYGVLAYAVTQRRREIGVRMALGALPSQIRGQFLGVGARLLGAGLALGGFGGWAVMRAMHSMLFDAGQLPVSVIVVTMTVMATAILLACWLPARRASQTDPIHALRCD